MLYPLLLWNCSVVYTVLNAIITWENYKKTKSNPLCYIFKGKITPNLYFNSGIVAAVALFYIIKKIYK